eukprot:2958549-Rhodomonas_salina.1
MGQNSQSMFRAVSPDSATASRLTTQQTTKLRQRVALRVPSNPPRLPATWLPQVKMGQRLALP